MSRSYIGRFGTYDWRAGWHHELLKEFKHFRPHPKAMSYTKHGIYKGRIVLLQFKLHLRTSLTQGQQRQRKICPIIGPAGQVCLILVGIWGRLLVICRLMIFICFVTEEASQFNSRVLLEIWRGGQLVLPVELLTRLPISQQACLSWICWFICTHNQQAVSLTTPELLA